jgi:lipopolysaccharide biosynthesis glycosyltransferase|tara:strand:- start:157 stop:1713 length:1557 start_codon:yes stop_codon:yes gene_type:complete
MKLLITTRADEGIKEMTDITHPILKKYADRVGADFMVLSHEPPSDSGDGRPHYRILKHYDLHEKYDRILHIDSDMIVMPNCPNLFDVVPYNKIGTVLEDKGSRKQPRQNLILESQREYGFVDWHEEYINTGLIMTSKCHRDIFQSIGGKYWTGFGSDDVQLGYLIKKNKFEIMDLPFQYNHMTMFSEDWNANPNRFKSHIIHYGGRGVFDNNVGSKMEQIRKDYDRIYGNTMKILFVGVFDKTKESTNTSQLLAFKSNGHDVIGYNYRKKALLVGNKQRDLDLVKVIQDNNFDLVVFSKCNVVEYEVFEEATKITKTCLWFMDPLKSYTEKMRKKTSLVSYFCCDKLNVLEAAKKINKNSFQVCEGFDETVDKVVDIEKCLDISFIGNVYGNRLETLNNINHDVKVVNNVFGLNHAKQVSKSKINLNFCTNEGASDRVYKIMAAGGFLLTNDWIGRDKDFVDGKDLVLFKDSKDLNEKISFYLKNEIEREDIAASGNSCVQKFNRISWAKKIVELCDV